MRQVGTSSFGNEKGKNFHWRVLAETDYIQAPGMESKDPCVVIKTSLVLSHDIWHRIINIVHISATSLWPA